MQCSLFIFHHFHKQWKHTIVSVLFPSFPQTMTTSNLFLFCFHFSKTIERTQCRLFCLHQVHHHKQQIMLSAFFPPFPLQLTVCRFLWSVSTISTTTDSTSCSLFCFHNFHYHRQYIMLSALFPALSSCVLCNHVTTPASDHRAVVKELNDQTFQCGPGYWKFNNSLLKNLSFIKMMNNRLDTVIKRCDSNCSDTDTWELCKVEIQHFCSEFEKRLSNPKRNHLLQCNIQVTEAERELIINPKDQTAQENLLKAKQKMEIIQLDKDRGAQIRARTKWIEEGERNTKYFCSLEKSRGKKKVMTELRRTTGETTTNQREIVQEQTAYYKNLYNIL